MKTWVWLSLCFACLSAGYCVGIVHSYLGTMKRMRVRAADEMRRMDEMAEACKKQIEYAYESAAKLVGVKLDLGGTK